MPRKTFKCICEVTIHAIRSPSCWLPNRDETYVTVEVFNSTKRTRLVDAIFPLIFHETFTFEKTFWSAQDAFDVVDMMEDVKVAFELRQVADVYLGGTLLAYFDSNGRDFFYPSPNTWPRLETDRELIMERTIDFPGISPRVEFSTYTVIQETSTPYLDAIEDAYLSKPVRTERSYCLEPPSRSPPLRSPIPHYERPTVTSILRSRSPSPRRAVREAAADIAGHRARSRSALGTTSTARSRSPSPLRGVARASEDNEVARIMRRYRSPSPSLRGRISPYLGVSEDLRRRVEEVLERSRMTLARYGSPPYYHRDSLHDLENELLMAKYRRY